MPGPVASVAEQVDHGREPETRARALGFLVEDVEVAGPFDFTGQPDERRLVDVIAEVGRVGDGRELVLAETAEFR